MHIWSDVSFIFSFSLHGQAVFLALDLLGKQRYSPFFLRKDKDIGCLAKKNIHLEVKKKK